MKTRRSHFEWFRKSEFQAKANFKAQLQDLEMQSQDNVVDIMDVMALAHWWEVHCNYDQLRSLDISFFARVRCHY